MLDSFLVTDSRCRPVNVVRNNASREVKALKLLTALSCQHAPTYFGDFEVDNLQGGHDHLVLMSKLPGKSLQEEKNWKYDKVNVRAAFEQAIEAVHGCSVTNGSANGRNILWDEVQGKWYVASHGS
jgi:hypothetical protein